MEASFSEISLGTDADAIMTRKSSISYPKCRNNTVLGPMVVAKDRRSDNDDTLLDRLSLFQVVTDKDTHETLLCTAYVFEVSTSEHGAQHHIYRLVKD